MAKKKKKKLTKKKLQRARKIKVFNRSFTLMELLIVIAIGALISVTVVISINNMFKKSRDARRKVDLGQIKGALESYYNDHFRFPEELSDLLNEVVGAKKYITALPTDPKTKSNYYYATDSVGSFYKLYAKMESIMGSGGYADTSCNSSLCNYIVTSPNITPEPTIAGSSSTPTATTAPVPTATTAPTATTIPSSPTPTTTRIPTPTLTPTPTSICGPNSTWNGTSCVCNQWYADCDGWNGNGCEALLLTDETCGSCTTSCPEGQSCHQGTCYASTGEPL